MKLKTLVLVVAILAVLSVAAYYLHRPPAATGVDPRINQPVFDPKTLDKTAEIHLTDQGRTVVLTRHPDGKWIVPSYYDIPADFSKLSHFIDDLSNAKIQRLVTQNPERLTRLEFKDTSISLIDSANHALWTLTLGKDAEGGGRFVRFGDEKKGYLANLGVYIDSTSKNWIDTALLNLKPDDIAGVEITFPEGAPVAATRVGKDAPWIAEQAPGGQRIKSDRITSLLSSFTGLRFEDTSDLTDAKVEAARQHSRTIKLTTFDHRTITIEIGRKPEEKKLVEALKPEVKGKNAADAGTKPEVANLASTSSPAEPAATPPTAETEATNPPPATPEEPKAGTIPAGPVYTFITNSDPAAPINAFMKARAFQTFDWNFTGLPQKRDELFEPVPVAPKK
jgi:hypothetical protein